MKVAEGSISLNVSAETPFQKGFARRLKLLKEDLTDKIIWGKINILFINSNIGQVLFEKEPDLFTKGTYVFKTGCFSRCHSIRSHVRIGNLSFDEDANLFFR